LDIRKVASMAKQLENKMVDGKVEWSELVSGIVKVLQMVTLLVEH